MDKKVGTPLVFLCLMAILATIAFILIPDRTAVFWISLVITESSLLMAGVNTYTCLIERSPAYRSDIAVVTASYLFFLGSLVFGAVCSLFKTDVELCLGVYMLMILVAVIFAMVINHAREKNLMELAMRAVVEEADFDEDDQEETQTLEAGYEGIAGDDEEETGQDLLLDERDPSAEYPDEEAASDIEEDAAIDEDDDADTDPYDEEYPEEEPLDEDFSDEDASADEEGHDSDPFHELSDEEADAAFGASVSS